MSSREIGWWKAARVRAGSRATYEFVAVSHCFGELVRTAWRGFAMCGDAYTMHYFTYWSARCARFVPNIEFVPFLPFFGCVPRCAFVTV